MKFLITNSVPLNGGDEALLRGLINAIAERWPAADVAVLCKDLDRCREQLPDLNLASDLEFAKSKESRQNTLGLYRSADIIISAPGGFLHDHYAIEERLSGFEQALAMSKPVLLLGQSIGPFWKPRSMKRVRQVLNRVSCICVRDEISMQYLAKCGVDCSHIRLTADIAFLWRRLAPELFAPRTGTIQLVGLSFRVWPLGDQSMAQQTIAKAERLCRHILGDANKRILFLSTCQGIEGYVDDSQLAAQILARLPLDLQQRCEVDHSRYPPQKLIKALGKCDAFIGMRLHACLLAMLSGVPAFGLGYEDKTEQIFRQMGLASYQMRFEETEEDWIEGAERLFDNAGVIRNYLPGALDKCSRAAYNNIMAIEEQLSNLASAEQVTPEERWTNSVQRYGQPHLRLRQVAALVNDLHPKRMLDIGCATGHLRMLCQGVDYTGVDFIAPPSPAGFSFYQCNFNRDPLPEELSEFDVIVCSGILEYIQDPGAFLTALRSRLAEGGHLILTYFNMNHISRIWALLRGNSFPVHVDWRGFHSPAEIRKILEHSGFRIVRSVAMNHAFRGATSVEDTVTTPLTLPAVRPWSGLLAHQLLFVSQKHGGAPTTSVLPG